MEQPQPIKLTSFSKGAGCGCKISPAVLEEILKSEMIPEENKKLLVGNSSNDDAAVYDLGNGMALISTTDFFTPIVNDPYDFGRVASANAISDIYAMGGKPILAIAILGWPVEKIPTEEARKVLEGSRAVCKEAGIPLAGGHSIDSPEPIFGLAVNGLINIEHLKKNNTAKEGDLIFLTKPIGTGILSTAQKRGLISEQHLKSLVKQLTTLNTAGEAIAKIKGVTAMTDITGFGLIGHLIEMAEGSGLSAEINYPTIQLMEGVTDYLTQRSIPDATYRNWNSYNKQVAFEKGINVMEAFSTLPDPQTNGGLLIAVNPEAVKDLQQVLKNCGLYAHAIPVGKFIKRAEKSVNIKG